MCGGARGKDKKRNESCVCLKRLLTRDGSMLMKLTYSELKDSKKMMMNEDDIIRDYRKFDVGAVCVGL